MPTNYVPPVQSIRTLCFKRCKKQLFVVGLCLLLFNNTLYAQKSNAFSTSTPEAEGVSAAGIDSFLTAASKSNHEFHSFMFLRHGKVIAQGWWNPYKPDLRHSLYSCSKSFTSTAIGFAVSEKRLSVNDKVVSFFPGSLPDTIKPYLAGLTVKDLLTMSVGQAADPTFAIASKQDDWVKSFLALSIANKPGSVFLYNSMATFMLSAIVQKVTGQKVVDYLKPRLFDPLGIKGIDWEINKQGINTGGWGLRVKTEDMAKLGQLYLQKGAWNGKQLLPKEWVEEATTFKIDQAPGVAQSKRDSSDWMQGYCYQFWRCRNNAFRADGAFGQYIVVMPDQDAVIAITSETSNMQEELNLVWKYLLPAIHQKALPAAKMNDDKLEKHLAALSLPPAANSTNNTNGTFNKTFSIEPNDLHISSITLNVANNICHVTLKKDTASYKLDFETGKWLPGKTDMQGPGLVSAAREDFSLLVPYKVEGSYAWNDSQTLQLKLRYIESPHTETITCHFNNQQLTADVEYSFTYGKNKVALQGKLIN
ncbi:serine hydrolase domain-containing protein [Mucilaginibacter aquaedulcis]|uniref:serine hydrolase domain-containing protein n=1 Tax=Mucilaginibacter aquaedulcis TaxID=1187081 RepID=UPI0025B49585|nr:serine hydrolase [Mucilaginibacter aquaedulcis]MDN3548589.1 serine hydrolase [Mucilaginibacter aquaedulcis]